MQKSCSIKVWKSMVKTVKQFITDNGMNHINTYYYIDYGYVSEREFPMFGGVNLFEINEDKLSFWNYEKNQCHIITLEQLDFKCILILCQLLDDILIACKTNDLEIVETNDFL